MSGDRFRLVSRWQLDAPEERVYAALTDIGGLSRWWSGVKTTPLREPPEVVGREASIELRGLALFRLRARVRIESVRPNREIRVVSHGDLEGAGTWRLRPIPRGTEATFEWEVQLRHPRMRTLARILRPLLVSSHAVAMRRGERGLQRLLSAGSDDAAVRFQKA